MASFYKTLFENRGKYNRNDKDYNQNTLMKYMINRSLAMFKYHDLPESIPSDILERYLQLNGNCIFTIHNDKPIILIGGFSGECDEYYRPKEYLVANPWAKIDKSYSIDDDCILIKNDSQMMGLLPIYAKYCSMLNENEISLQMACINQRVQAYLSANDDSTLESARQFISQLEKGTLSIIAEQKLFDSLKISSIGNSNANTLKNLIEHNRFIKASLYNEIGLTANDNMKREKLTVAEVEENNGYLYPLIDNMKQEREKAIEKINKKYNLNISIEFTSSWDYRIFAGENVTEKELKENDNPSNNVDNVDDVDDVDNKDGEKD